MRPRRRNHRARQHRRSLRQVDVDFLLLAVFGARYLPNDVAHRIALRRELARGIEDAFARADRVRPSQAQVLEALAAGALN